MKYIYFLLLVGIIFLNSCDSNYTESDSGKTAFNFSVKGEKTGKLSAKSATIQCDENRTIITFKERIPTDMEAESDLLFGEIILAFLPIDSIGTFLLNPVTATRVNGQVGFVALLNTLHFDDLSNQYISNTERLQDIKTGNLTIEKWSKHPEELIKGSLEVTLVNNDEEVIIQGDFTTLVENTSDFCR